jgi:single-stranded-DNA-specific exonuclease
MMTSHRWTVADPDPRAADLARLLRTSPLIAQILLNRRLDDPVACHAFLAPKLSQLHDPASLAGLGAAAERIAEAIRRREKIVIYGDYDVDGITATAILWHAIRLLGGDVHYYIPHRIDEGYGLNSEAVWQICRDGAKLIVSVDCGITAIAPVQAARDAGVEVIVTDHHEWRSDDGTPVLPAASAIVHPRLPDERGATYPNPHLCGAGVAFKLAWGIGQAMAGGARVGEAIRDFLLEATALAALGTIADVVPLVGENRVLARFGLGNIKKTQLVGLRALIESAALADQKIDSVAVGFRLAPRLNACGRMGHAAAAVEMLTTATPDRAIAIAIELEQHNRARQATERQIVDEAIEQIESLGYAEADRHAIVVGGKGWSPGVVGIVASRLVDRYHRPTIVCGLEDGCGHGSGRSISGYHLAQALEACDAFLDTHGGHEMAAGLRVKQGQFDAFREAFCEHARRSLAPELLVPELKIDCEAELGHINAALVNDLERLGPFGPGNRRPLICCRGVELAADPRRVGRNGDHLQLFLRQNGVAMKAIAFGAGGLFEQLRRGKSISMAVEPQINEWNGRSSVELEVRDLQIG